MERRNFLKAAGIGTLAFTTAGFECACPAAPSWVITAEGIAEEIVPIAGTILSIIDPPLAPMITLVVNGFNAVLKALQDLQTAILNGQPTTSFLQVLQSVFATLQADAASLLSAFGASSSRLDSVVSMIIGLIMQAVSNLSNLFPKGLHTAKLSRAFPSPNSWKGADFKSRYDFITKNDRRFKPL